MSIFSAMLRRSAKRRMYVNLMQLDDHLLKDIGLTRADIRAAIVDPQAALTGAHARS
jgi:uncharacterized protein YjiS (DUF1127 family)